MKRPAVYKSGEARARAIWEAPDLRGISHAECRAADKWIAEYANLRFQAAAQKVILDQGLRKLVCDWVRLHTGSVEVDDLFIRLGCYPEWMNKDRG